MSESGWVAASGLDASPDAVVESAGPESVAWVVPDGSDCIARVVLEAHGTSERDVAVRWEVVAVPTPEMRAQVAHALQAALTEAMRTMPSS